MHDTAKKLITAVQVNAVSGFIEQVGSMIKGISKHNYHPSPPHNSI